MSRIGKKPVPVPGGVKVDIQDRTITVEGPKGKLQWEFRPEVEVATNDRGELVVTRQDDTRLARSLHGTTRSLLVNMMVGVSEGYEKRLELVGVGYIATVQHGLLQLRVGFANELEKVIPPGLDVNCPNQQHISIKGIDKQQVTQFAAEVRALRKPEPYKGKGIRYEGEQVRRKQGKVMAK